MIFDELDKILYNKIGKHLYNNFKEIQFAELIINNTLRDYKPEILKYLKEHARIDESALINFLFDNHKAYPCESPHYLGQAIARLNPIVIEEGGREDGHRTN